MKRFVEGMDRGQSTLFPECLEDWICEDNPVRVIDVFEPHGAVLASYITPKAMRHHPTIAGSSSCRDVGEIRKSANPGAPGDATLSICMSST